MEQSDDNKMFEDLLKSIGIEHFDPNVAAALNDYARRFASELICDAKDYSVHRQATEIGVEDLKLAVRLSDVRVTGVDPRDQIIKNIKEKINRKDLVALVDKESALIRYPKNMFLQRNHTFVPGHEAYDEPPPAHLRTYDDHPIVGVGSAPLSSSSQPQTEMEVDENNSEVNNIKNENGTNSHSSHNGHTNGTANTETATPVKFNLNNNNSINGNGNGSSSHTSRAGGDNSNSNKRKLESAPGFSHEEDEEE